MNDKKNKYLLKNTIIFSIGNFGSKFLSFLLIPFYTNYLSTYQYGIVDLITVISMIIVPLFTLNISESIMRFAMDKNSDKNSVFNIGLLMIIITTIFSFLLALIISIFNFNIQFPFLICLFIIALASSQILMCYIRGIEKLLAYSIISIVQSTVIIFLTIFFLKYYNMGIKGYLLSYVIAYFLTSVFCLIISDIQKINREKKLNKNLFKQMLKYSLLLIPNSLMWWIIGSLDKVMITQMINVESNGIYSISYKIPTILVSLTTIFNQAWMISAIKEKDSKDKEEYTNSVFNTLFVFVLFLATTLIIFIKPITYIYVGAEFYDSWKYVSPLLLGTVFLTLGTFISNEYTVHKDSKGFLKSSTIGAICNLFLNCILIPICGIVGAAIATCISYIAVFNYRLYDSKKYVKINFYSSKRIISLILITIISLLSYFNNIYLIIMSIIIYTILLIMYNKDIIKIIKVLFKMIKRRV